MRRMFLSLLLSLALLLTCAAIAEDYRVSAGNEMAFETLLTDLLSAYQTPAPEDGAAIEADLSAIEAVSAADGAIARAIAEHWQRVYLDPDYRLNLWTGGEYAETLAQTGLVDSPAHAFVVLGYELKDGGMTDELKGRCDAAAAAARSFPSAIIVCSGGATGENNPEQHTEAGLMRDYLVNAHGIDPARIHIDERAMTTVDNALNTFGMLRENGIQTFTIITSTYHQRWGQAIYNAVGALYRQSAGYSADIVENYCFDIEPSNEMFLNDAGIAVRQLGTVLNLPDLRW